MNKILAKPKDGYSEFLYNNEKYPIDNSRDILHELFSKIKIFITSHECQELEIHVDTYHYTIYIGSPVYAHAKLMGDIEIICPSAENFIKGIIEDIEKDIKEWTEFSGESIESIKVNLEEVKMFFDNWK